MNQGRDLLATRESITPRAIGEIGGRLVSPGTVLLSFKLSIGKVGIARIPLFTNEAIAALPILATDKVSPEYLYWALRSMDLTVGLDRAAKGLTLNKPKLFAMPVPVPSVAEQQRIVDVLDCAEALRVKRRASIALLNSLTSAIFLEMFGELSAGGLGWPFKELKDLIADGPQNGLYRPSSAYGRGVPILRIDGFYDGSVVDMSALKRVDLAPAERKPFELAEGDIVINRVNSIEYLGKCALIPTLTEPTVFESNMMRFRVEPAEIHPRFLIHVLQTEHIRSQIRSRAKRAVNQASINQTDVGTFRVPLPPLPLQDQFVSRVVKTERVKLEVQKSASVLDSLSRPSSTRPSTASSEPAGAWNPREHNSNEYVTIRSCPFGFRSTSGKTARCVSVMALTRDFKNTVVARVRRDPRFAKALLDEAATVFLNGEPETARLILRDLVNATVGFEGLAQKTAMPSKSLHRMLSERGNPSMDNLAAIFNAVRSKLKVGITVRTVAA